MVEVSNPGRLVEMRRRGLLFVALIAALVAGFWAMAGVDGGLSAHPAVRAVWRASMALTLIVGGLWVVTALVSRLRQTGPESERETSLTAFSDTSKGLGRAVLPNLVFSLVNFQVWLALLAHWLTLIDRQAWLKALAATPFLLVMAWIAIAPYPALIRNWRSRRAAAGG